MDDLGHRQIQIHDEADGARVAVDLAKAGYGAEHSATLAHRRQPDGTHELGLVEELDFQVVRPFLVEVYRRDLPQASPHVVEKFADFRSAVQQRVGTRFFARRIDGLVAGACELYLHDGAAQVDHVDTLEEFRGRGIASSIVLCAVSEARAVGADLVCIDADLDDWPIGLYRRLGFVEIGHAWAFTNPRLPRQHTTASHEAKCLANRFLRIDRPSPPHNRSARRAGSAHRCAVRLEGAPGLVGGAFRERWRIT